MNVFRTNEVYKHIPYNVHNRNEVVAVRGVYVTGDFRPPYYNEPCIHIGEISSIPATVVDFTSEEYDISPTQTGGFYKLELTPSTYTIQRYGTESTDTSPSQTGGFYKMGMTSSTLSIEKYEKDFGEPTPSQTGGLYKVGLTASTFTIQRYNIEHGNSTPEPMLRITQLSSGDCTVTNAVSLMMME